VSFFAEIKRRKVFQVAAVYAVVAWLLVQIVATVEEPLSLPGWFDTAIIVFLAVGFPVTMILTWAFDLTPDRAIRDQRSEATPASGGRTTEYILIGLLGLVVAWVVARDLINSTGAPLIDEETVANEAATTPERNVIPNSIAVLVCDNLSPDPDNAYIAQSLHEEMLNQLFKLRDLRVISRTSVLPYMGAERPPLLEIAEDLKVQTIMECSVAYGDDRVAISAQLIDPDTGVHLWSERYYRDLSDVFAVQFDIATNIANALAIEFL
jgi:TolB-like protein